MNTTIDCYDRSYANALSIPQH